MDENEQDEDLNEQDEVKPATKKEAVTRIIKKYPHISLKSGVSLIKERWGIDIKEGSFSAFRVTILREQQGRIPTPKPRKPPMPKNNYATSSEPSIKDLLELKTCLAEYPGGFKQFRLDYAKVNDVAEKSGGFDALEALIEYMDKLGIATN